ncbi:MAG: HD domain-containing phosphohydrolase [Planctomycetota bacterium]|jgi:response regulator RpfG family c-di-GMP phosphodiesterase
MGTVRQQTILIADDNSFNRQLFEKLLIREGYTVAHAGNGQEAIEIARSILPHVILMDVIMPVLDGLEATKALRKDPETKLIPIIIVSAKDEEEDVVTGLAAGADEYIVKPIQAKDFHLRIQSMVRLREAQLEIEQANASLRAQTKLLTKLNQFCEAVLVENSFENTCKQIVETAADIMESRRVSLLIPDESENTLRIASAIGIDQQAWHSLTIPVNSSISGYVYRTQQEMVVNSNASEPPTINRYDTACFISIPLVCTPLRATDGPLAVLNVTDKIDGTDYAPKEVEMLRQLAQAGALALSDVKTHRKLDIIRDSIIISMAKLSEFRHTPTGKHLERVSELSKIVAHELSQDPLFNEIINEQFITDIGRAAPLHDIGKVSIPDSILLKQGKLTAEEFESMKQHTHIGAKTLESVISCGHDASFVQMAMDIAHYHHERYDGNGYPEGLAGEDIPLCARIVCLVDSYDAIRTEREYKPARSHEDAIEELLRASASQFDPRVVHAFCSIEKKISDTYATLSEEQSHIVAKEDEPELVFTG